MIVKRLVVGQLDVNCYLVADEKTDKVIVIDPGAQASQILQMIKEKEWQLEYIINTHGHADHIAANKELLTETEAELLIHQADSDFLQNSELNLSAYIGNPSQKIKSPQADNLLVEGDLIESGNLTFEVIHTPGHTPGSISLKSAEGLFSGDTVFARGVGRTDFPHGSSKDLKISVNKLVSLPPELKLYPGHGPTYTLEEVKSNNPYL
ncbi:MBL fold metallo-hydrolase [Halanaerocella petrolearia]